LKGAPKEVGGGFRCNGNVTLFTIEEIRAISKVGKSIYVKW